MSQSVNKYVVLSSSSYEKEDGNISKIISKIYGVSQLKKYSYLVQLEKLFLRCSQESYRLQDDVVERIHLDIFKRTQFDYILFLTPQDLLQYLFLNLYHFHSICSCEGFRIFKTRMDRVFRDVKMKWRNEFGILGDLTKDTKNKFAEERVKRFVFEKCNKKFSNAYKMFKLKNKDSSYLGNEESLKRLFKRYGLF